MLISGRVWAYGDNINTDVIFPGKYTYTVTARDEIARHALENAFHTLMLLGPAFEIYATDLDGRADQRAYGAIDVAVRRNAFGRQVDSFEADLDIEGLSSPFHAVFIRAPFVEGVGSGVEVLASTSGHPVLCRQGSVIVSAFHPELTDDLRIHQLFLSLT